MTLKYDHLLGKPFVYGEQDCYTTIRDFFADNFNLALPNYARPGEFWKHGMDMYMERYMKNGFEVLNCHPSEYREGDVFLMAISSSVANHAGVLVENGQILHHLWGRFSAVDPYRDIFRNTTVAILRNPTLVLEKPEFTTDISDIPGFQHKKKSREDS